MTKSEIQEEAVASLIENKRLIVEFSTGVGKSKVAIDFLKKHKDFKVLLVVAEILHKKNWEDEFKKWGAARIFKGITVECYASLHKYKDTQWDFLILDEGHHIGTDLKMDILSTIKAEYVICLSATFPKRSLLYPLEKIFGRFAIKSVNIQKAIDNNLLPEPTIYTIPLTLNTRNMSESIVEEWGNNGLKIAVEADYQSRWVYKRNRIKYPNIKMTVKCTQYQKYLYLCEQYNYWKKISAMKNSTFAKNKQMRFGSDRKEFLGTIKTPYVWALMDKLEKEGKRYMCFCTNIEQCDVLGGEYAIHSKKKDSQQVVDNFNSLATNKLFAVFKGVEGMNFNQIDAGILVQLDGSKLKTTQKSGRFYRAENPEIYIFYFKNTRDQEFLEMALEGMDKQYIKQLNYDELVAKD